MIEILLQAESALSFGLLDRAETLYRQVAAADPRNAMALVGLARVALERGDEATALSEGRRALAIDAENVAARRLVERLEEVRWFRGEAVAAAASSAESPGRATPPGPAAPAAPSTATPSIPGPGPAPRRSLVDRLLRRR